MDASPRSRGSDQKEKILVGWREWFAFPELGIPGMKGKLDTGARTSSLHAFFVREHEEKGRVMVEFGVHPHQYDRGLEIVCRAPLADRRQVMDSGGHRHLRRVIVTEIQLGDRRWPIEVTLADRETMRFNLLIGRTAMKGRMEIDPARSFLAGKGLGKALSARVREGGKKPGPGGAGRKGNRS